MNYIAENLKKGFTEEEIIESCTKGDWKKDEILRSTIEARNFLLEEKRAGLPPPPLKKSELDINMKKIGMTQIFLYLGGLIIVLAGIIFIGINWEKWGSIGRILATFIPMIFIYSCGLYWWIKDKFKKVGFAFIFTASIIFPIFLIVTFSELEIFKEGNSDSFGLTVSLLSLLQYVILNYIIKKSFWSLLYVPAGCFFYYFLLKLMEFDSFDEGMTLLFLIPSFIFLGLGIIYEIHMKIKYSKYLYLFGILIFIGLFIRLAVTGSIVDNFGVTIDEEELSFVVVGILFLVSGFVLEKLKYIQLRYFSKHSNIFFLLGTFIFLGSFLILGTGGEKPFYETMVLIFSLGFIFSNALKQSKIFLYGGALFLMIYIFTIGWEYFEDDVGWPLTLFISGLISMFIGYGIERLKKNQIFKREMK